MARQMKDSGIEWIGEIPENWETIRFKYLHNGMNTGEAIDKENWTADDNDQVFYTAGLVPIHTNYSAFPDWKLTTADDLLLARNGTPYVYYPQVDACYTDHIIRAMMKRLGNKRFIQYCLQQSIASVVVETVSIPTWSASLWNEQVITWPSEDEQHRIAAFLDHKCAEIDAVIERTKATIEEYKKLKQAVITEAVTKGVRGTRPMKDSGIEWIGEIPEGWATVQLKRLARISTGSTPPKNEESTFYSQDSGCLWIKAEDLGTSNNIETTTEYLTEAGKREGRIFPPCTVYVCCIASVGKVGYCVTEASCNQQINGLIFENAHWKYGFYLSLAQEEEYLLNASGNVMKILNTDKHSRLMCPCPPVEEQVEIATFLDGKCAALDTLIAKKTALLTELETYKKSLIYEYVTGKKEVTA